MYDKILPDLNDQDGDEDLLMDLISKRVAELLDDDPGLLFSYMYRLDIEEHKLKAAIKIKTGENQIKALAQLILDRQKLRMMYREKFKTDEGSDNI